MRSEIGDPSVRPWRMPAVTSARSLSIFIRPPRPWPSWRRARSRSMSSGASSRPAGSPSTTGVSPGPCDSPAFGKPSPIGREPYWGYSALLALLRGDRARVQQAREHRLVGGGDGAAAALAELRRGLLAGRVALRLVL